jgi:thiol:disulfide interchange protein DsbD
MLTTILMTAFAAGLALQPGAENKNRPHVSLKIVSEETHLRPGATQTLGLVFTMEPHWHVYYKGLEGGGNPPKIEQATLPDGYTLGEIEWPAPQRYVAPGDVYDSVYEGQVTLLVPLNVPKDAKPGEKVTIGVKMNWLECSEVCVFGAGQSSIALKVSADAAKKSDDATLIDASRAKMPTALPTDGSIVVKVAGGAMTVQATKATRLEFYPGAECTDVDDPAKHTRADGPTLKVPFAGPNKNRARGFGVLGVWAGPGEKPAYHRIDASEKGG